MDPERPRPAADPTGDPRVDAAIAGLASLDDMDLAERPAVLEAVHERLRGILGELGDHGRPEPASPVLPGEESVLPGAPGARGGQGELGPGARR